MRWRSVITNAATDTLYLSGYTWSMTYFSSSDTGSATFAAKYSLQTMSYVWIKAYTPCLSDVSIAALNKAEDTLAIV